MPAPLLAALLCLAPPAAGEPGPPGESGLPVVRTVETPGVPTPPQTLRVEDRGGWVVVTLTVDPPAADEEEADPPAAGDEEEDDAGGGAFGDSGGEGEDADDADDETVPADRPAAGPEWAVVLCEVDPAVTPAVVAGGEEAPGSVAVRYGPYFVRDDAGQLRVLRQPKPAPAAGGANETPAWALTDLPADPTWSGYGGGGAIRLAAVKQGGWFWTLSQPDAGLRETLGGGDGDGEEPDATTLPADVLVRVAPAASGGYGSSAYGRGLTEFSVSGDGDGGGDATVRDEGDLLTADRTPSWMPAFMEAFERRAAAREAARADLAGKPAPMLDAVVPDFRRRAATAGTPPPFWSGRHEGPGGAAGLLGHLVRAVHRQAAEGQRPAREIRRPTG